MNDEDAIDKLAYAEIRATYIRLRRIRREKAAIIERMKTVGRVRKKQQRTHKEHDQRISDDYYGIPAVTLDGKIVEAEKPAWLSRQDFYRRFRMGPKMFSKLLFDIQHKDTGHPAFRPQPDARGQLGPSWRSSDLRHSSGFLPTVSLLTR